jgi:hypothetical protein
MNPGSQKPPKQSPEQHCALDVHAPLICVQLVPGGAQAPTVQLLEQHPVLPVHVPPTGVHGVLQTRVAGSHAPRQHCPSVVHAAFSPRQVSAPNMQRFGSWLSSQTSVQQPRPEPDVQVSPVGRQLRLARSIWHSPPWQMSEQHSAFVAQVSLSTLHRPPPQRPPKQPSEQQSSAFAQATPSAKQAFVQRTTPACPVTGAQRALQHCSLAVQSAPGPMQAPPPGTIPPPAPPALPVPPRPEPPSLMPAPGAALPPPHEASNQIANRQDETGARRVVVRMRYRAAVAAGG